MLMHQHWVENAISEETAVGLTLNEGVAEGLYRVGNIRKGIKGLKYSVSNEMCWNYSFSVTAYMSLSVQRKCWGVIKVSHLGWG